MKTNISTLMMIVITTGIFLMSSCSKSMGTVTFWVQNDLGSGGPITVAIQGQSNKTITTFYTGGITACDASGCASFSLFPKNDILSPATYIYIASNSDSSKTWCGSFSNNNVTDGGCYLVKLDN